MHTPASGFTELPSGTLGYDYYTGILHDEEVDGERDFLSVTRSLPDIDGNRNCVMRRYYGNGTGNFFPSEDEFDNARIILSGENGIARVISVDIYGNGYRMAVVAASHTYGPAAGYASSITTACPISWPAMPPGTSCGSMTTRAVGRTTR